MSEKGRADEEFAEGKRELLEGRQEVLVMVLHQKPSDLCHLHTSKGSQGGGVTMWRQAPLSSASHLSC